MQIYNILFDYKECLKSYYIILSYQVLLSKQPNMDLLHFVIKPYHFITNRKYVDDNG